MAFRDASGRIPQQIQNPYDSLFNIIGTVMGQNAKKRQDAKMYADVANFDETLNNLDYGGQTQTQDLTPQNSAGNQQIAQGLLPTGFNQQAPTSDMIGQGLLGQAIQQPSNIQQAIEPAQKSIDQYSQANNPVAKTVSEPKTLQQQTKMIKSQIPLAMKDLMAKGYDPREILPLLQQAAKDKIDEHTNTYQQRQMEDLYQGFITEENPNKKAMYAARLKNMGYDVTTAYKEFAPTYQSEKINTGGQQFGMSFNPKTGKYEQQFMVNNTVSPDAQLGADTRIRTTGMNNATTLQAAAMRAARGGGSGRSSNYQTGAGTMNGKQVDPEKIGLYNDKYNEIMNDIYDSNSPQERAAKVNNYATVLNSLGQVLDKDIQNDVDYITKTNPLGADGVY